MPLHQVRKFSEKLQRWVIKSEYYIFDALRFAKKPAVLLVPRDLYFAPLKNGNGADSLETVRQAYRKKDRMVFEAISSTHVPEGTSFELCLDFHYPTKELLVQCKGKPLPKEGEYCV